MRTYLGVLRRLFRGKSLSREIFSFSKSSLFLGTIPGKEDFSMRNSHCSDRIRKPVADTAQRLRGGPCGRTFHVP